MSLADMPHSILVCEGSGDPEGLELTPGRKLGPIDVGTESEWRVTAEGVMAHHAYLFFDGRRLFVQSAEEDTPIKANGREVPTEWVSVEAPCEIIVGEAILWFDANHETKATAQAPKKAPGAPANWADDDIDDEDSMPAHLGDMTTVMQSEDDIDDEDSMPEHLGDKTNVFPVEEFMARTSATRRAALAQLLNLPVPPGSQPSGITPPPSVTGGVPSTPGLQQPPPSNPFAVPVPTGSQPGPPPSSRGMNGPPSVPSSTAPVPFGSQPSAPPPSTSQPGMPLQPLGTPTPFGDDGDDEPGSLLPSADPAGQTAKTAAPKLSQWKRMSFPQKATAILFLPMVASVIVIFTDTGPKPTRRPATTTTAVASASGTVPAVEPTADEPPETSPPDAPETSDPKLAQNTPDDDEGETASGDGDGDGDGDSGDADGDDGGEPDKGDKAEKLAKGEKTLQRQAVDALASGRYETAARLYEQLAKEHPTNTAYAAAAVITRQKLEAKK